LWLPKSLWCLASKWWIYLCFLQNWVVFTHLWRMLDMYGYVANSQLIPNSCWLNPNPNSAGHGAWIQQHGRPRLVWSSSSPWLNARLWPQILRSFVLHDSIDWFRCENLSRKPYKHIITSYVYRYICIYPHPWKGVGGTRALAHSIISLYMVGTSDLGSWKANWQKHQWHLRASSSNWCVGHDDHHKPTYRLIICTHCTMQAALRSAQPMMLLIS
jgi:hypothetical protein